MIGSNLVVEGVPGNHHHHHHHHHPLSHHHALAGAVNHPLHTFSAIHHHLNPNASPRAHLMSAATFAEPYLKASNGPAAGGGGSLLQPSPPKFAHPLPKPAPLVARYNGVTSSSLNGGGGGPTCGKLPPPPSVRLSSKYAAPDSESPLGPVNLVQSKDAPSSSPSTSSPSSPSTSVTVDMAGHPAYSLYSAGSRLYQPNPTYPSHFAPPPPPPPPPSTLQSGPYGPLYPPNPFTPMLHRGGPADNHRGVGPAHLLPPLQSYVTDSAPPHLKSPPTPVGLNGMLKTIYESPVVPIVAADTSSNGGADGSARGEKRPFKVPCGKEGSLKHRILTRPEPSSRRKIPSSSPSASRGSSASTTNPLLPPPPPSLSSSISMGSGVMTAASHRNGMLTAAAINASTADSSAASYPVGNTSYSNHNHHHHHHHQQPPHLHPSNNNNYHNYHPPHSKHRIHNAVSGANHSSNGFTGGSGSGSGSADNCANNPVLPKFIKGSLIKLADGSLKKVEDMQMEDFITCVEKSTTVRIDPSTVVRIQENAHKKGMTTVTLSYGEQRNQVDVETTVEHPYFVVKRGWSSYSPDKTLQIYRLSCHQLQVGDVCLTLSPKTANTTHKTSANGGPPDDGGGGGSGGGGGPSSGGPRGPSGPAGSAAVAAAGGGSSPSAAAAYTKNDLKINGSSPDSNKDDSQSAGSGSCSNSSGNCSSNSNCSSSSSSSIGISGSNYNNANSSNKSSSSNGRTSNSGSGGGGKNNGCSLGKSKSHRHYAAAAIPAEGGDGGASNNASGAYGSRIPMVNGHDNASSKKFVEPKQENDNNNNNSSIGDQYDGLPSGKKKRRWSAPDQFSDEYKSPAVSVASPTGGGAEGGCGASLAAAIVSTSASV